MPGCCSMSNFAAMSFPISGLLSAVSKATSKIIDGFLETAYAFLEVCVESGMWLGRKTLGHRVQFAHRPVGGGVQTKPRLASKNQDEGARALQASAWILRPAKSAGLRMTAMRLLGRYSPVLRRPSCGGLRCAGAEADANHVQQFVIVGGLLEKCCCPGLQGLFFVVLGIASAQDDDGNSRESVAVLEAVEDDEAIADRKAEIQNDQRRAFFLGRGDGGITVAGGGDLVVVGPQSQPQGTQ